MTACKLCVHPDQAAVADAFAKGLTDRQIGKLFNISHMAAFRHRVRHVVQPLRDSLAIVDKDDRAARTRRKALAGAASGTASTMEVVEAALGLRAMTQRVVEVADRLERAASRAEATDAIQHIAPLSAAALRAVETGSRLASTGGFAPQRDTAAGVSGPRFSITIMLGNGRDVSIKATPQPQYPGANEIEGEIAHELDGSGDPV